MSNAGCRWSRRSALQLRLHFCTQSARPGLVCWVPQLSSLIQPVRDASVCCADTDPSTTRPQTSKKTKTIRFLIILASFYRVQSLRKGRDRQCGTYLNEYPPPSSGQNCTSHGRYRWSLVADQVLKVAQARGLSRDCAMLTSIAATCRRSLSSRASRGFRHALCAP